MNGVIALMQFYLYLTRSKCDLERGYMKILAIANSKGGVAKSTTAANTGAALVDYGRSVLLIDLDPQASLTFSLGFQAHKLTETVYNLLKGDGEGGLIKRGSLDLIPANLALSEAEFELAGQPGREYLLAEAINDMESKYEYILIDCPPSLGLLTINALTAASGLIVPLQTEYLALQGIASLFKIYKLVKKRLNKKLEIFGVVATRHDRRKNLNREVLEAIKVQFEEKLFQTVIRENVALAEAPAAGRTIFEHAPNSYGAADYRSLAKEIVERVKNG